MHFWTTWFPFWSLTHFRTWPSSSRTISFCKSGPMDSKAFWITRQPYIWSASGRTCPKILLARAVFASGDPNSKNFLNDVVSEDVRHERIGWSNNFTEYQSLFSWSGSLQFLLNESGAMLILREFDHVICEVAELQIRKPIITKVF